MSLYDFDPVGNNPANRVTETFSTGTINGSDVAYFMLDAAPFYGDTVEVVDKSTGDFLTPGIDFKLGHEFTQGTTKLNKAVYGSVFLTDPNRVGTFAVVANTIGGDFVTPESQAIASGLAALDYLSNIKWEDIQAVPSVFPPTPHDHPLSGVQGLDSILNEVAKMTLLLNNRDNRILLTDIADLDTTLINPFLTQMANAVAAIGNLKPLSGHYVEQADTAGVVVQVGPIAVDTWTDTGLELTLQKAGEYLIDASLILSNTTWQSAEGTLQWRWVFNEQELTPKYALKYVIAVTRAGTLKLQVRPLAQPLTAVEIGNRYGSSSVSAMLIKEQGA